MEKNIKRMSFAALAALAMVSCSNHDEWMSYEEFQAAKYDAAFVQKYGNIDPNHDWGFGSVTTKAVTRAIQPSYEFPSDADASKFLTEVPAGIEAYNNINDGNGYASGMSSYINEDIVGKIKKVNIWDGGAGTVLYVSGNCDFTNKSFYLGPNSELYLVKGATLTISSSDAVNLQGGTNVYIAEGAKLVTTGELKANKGMHIYNHGTIEANQLSVNENSIVYNVGTMTVTNKVSVDNGESVIVNDGTITADQLNTAGSGKFENNNKVTISDITTVNSNSNTWVNNGQYETDYFIYNAASDEVINNCKMIVNEDFNMNLGDNAGNGNFKMDAGSSVITKNFNGGRYKAWYPAWNNYREFNGGPFFIYMGSNSVFKVTGTATMDATKANYGIYGPETGDYAVFQAAKIVAGQAGQGYEVTYGGNLAVVTESHFANGTSGTYPYIDIKGNAAIYAEGFTAGAPDIYIPESECNPGFGKAPEVTDPEEPTDPEPTDPEEIPYAKRIICEDLGATDDFDFNDVVFDALIKDGKTYIKLLAAGGTMKLTVAGHEVHKEFGVDVTTMVNTGLHSEEYKEFVVDQAYDSYADIPVVVELKDAAGEFNSYELKNSIGAAPKKICVDTDYKWTDERQQIEEKYPKFKNYVGNYNMKTDWYK